MIYLVLEVLQVLCRGTAVRLYMGDLYVHKLMFRCIILELSWSTE